MDRESLMQFIAIFFILYAVAAVGTLLREDMFAWVMTDFLVCGMAVLALMTATFFVGRAIKRYDLIDAAWGWAFMMAAFVSFWLQPGGEYFEFDTQVLVTLLVFIWGGRLSWHILRRILATSREDPRYVELRKKWKGNLEFNVFTRIYLVQAALALIISIPVIHINLFTNNGWTWWTYVGLVVWTVGFVFETVGDRQLRNFVTNPANKGKLMTVGLWRYSRHPNYFGEITQWWGIFIICLGVPYGWVGVVGPVLISYLILFVSGIPLNEKRFEGRPGWKQYKAHTSALLPLPPQKG